MSHQKELVSEFAQATFAGGCFWCIESAFAGLPGIIQSTSGLTGGDETPGSYEEAHMDSKGHLEAVQLIFDPKVLDYQRLLDIFWQQIDPTDPDGQFVDRGPLYRTAIFYHNTQQQDLAELSKTALRATNRFTKPIVTAILPAKIFYPADEYHQGYWAKYPQRYRQYRSGSGRDEFISEHWESK